MLTKFIFPLQFIETNQLDSSALIKKLISLCEEARFNSSDLFRGDRAAELLREFLGAMELIEQGVHADVCSQEEAFDTFLSDDEFSALFAQDQVELDYLLGETKL